MQITRRQAIGFQHATRLNAVEACVGSPSASKREFSNRCESVNRRRVLKGAAGVWLFLGVTGCGYTVGNNFRPNIKTVAVPIFENQTNHKGLEFELTDAVHKEIKTRTPYHLAKGLDADTKLTGQIMTFGKNVLGETRNDDPRELQVSLTAKVVWEDLRSRQVLAQQEIPITAHADFAPEMGQSMATAMDDTYQLMARRIVYLMEMPSLSQVTETTYLKDS